jgi:phospholipase/carboxylesterase
MGPLPLPGPFRPPRQGPARQLVVFLHGLGADGHDLIDLSEALAPALPNAAFHSPHAPFPYDMAAFGRQWFSLREWTPAALANGADHAASRLHGYLDSLQLEYGLTARDIALVGFSQGGMMALHVGLRRPSPPAAIVGFSCALIAPERLAAEITGRPPVLLVHGGDDQVVPAVMMQRAHLALESAGVPVEILLRPGIGHGIDQPGIEAAAGHLAAAFGY